MVEIRKVLHSLNIFSNIQMVVVTANFQSFTPLLLKELVILSGVPFLTGLIFLVQPKQSLYHQHIQKIMAPIKFKYLLIFLN